MSNGLERMHPFVLFLYYVAVGVLAMYFNHPLFLGVGCIVLILVNLTHDNGKALKKWIPMLSVMCAVIILVNPFINSRGTHIFFYFRGKQVTLEATLYGAVLSMSLVLILLMFISFNLILNGNKFLFVFSRFLPRTAFLTMLAIRFVPLLNRRLDEIADVQRVKGLSIKTGTIRQRAKSGMVILQVLLTWSLEEAIETSDSMKARGYGIGKRSPYIPYRLARQEVGWLVTLAVLLLICLVGGLLGYGKIIIYPQLGTLQLYPIDWIVFISMLVIMAFPLLIEGRELLKWNYSLWKTSHSNSRTRT
ncbi:energy-coupling factor transporter transmembrane component T [Filibacter tadaridae]|uniref:Energy-coupling factor transporter transmembrane protein EcfT n=1 Tax=Filibacter tadaridae TaxID=2483811 RepID=A0A3P5WUM7_9BACL|nr:energy-coupling factor transporter transmembrane component T [Filibacter tadaridae]VDC25042.1 Energy-coupling factor transporter transmembrane protein EcfT [Filibacter tadaridae]